MWVLNQYCLFQELGHSLGLSHSDVKSSLMAPFYRGYEANIRLDQDDIEGIRALYGEKEVKVKSVNNVSDSDNKPQTRVDNKVQARDMWGVTLEFESLLGS